MKNMETDKLYQNTSPFCGIKEFCVEGGREVRVEEDGLYNSCNLYSVYIREVDSDAFIFAGRAVTKYKSPRKIWDAYLERRCEADYKPS